MSLTLLHRPTWLEIDLTVFEKNLAYIKQKASEKEVWAVVKADCYHHGLKSLFLTFIKQNIYSFCVSQFDEAVYLQQIANEHKQDIRILILGDIDPQQLLNVLSNWRISVSSLQWLEACEIEIKIPIQVHIKINSGMNRRGLKSKQAFTQIFEKLQGDERFSVEGAYTHFATADDNREYMDEQFKQFKHILNGYEQKLRYIHSQNSHGLEELVDADDYCNLVRPGAICYGLSVMNPRIQPIATLYSTIIEKSPIQKGEHVSYGYTYQAQTDGVIGVLPIGYADGFWRSNSGYTVRMHQTELPIVGRVCMEQCMVFSEVSTAFKVGDVVEIFGVNKPISMFAAYNNTIDYEIMCSMANRIPRKYSKKEEV